MSLSRPRLPAPCRRGVTACSGAALLLVTVGCGGGTPTVTAPGSGATASPAPQGQVVAPARDFGDACRLLSPAEVQAAVGGGPLTATPRSDPQTGSVCTYAPASGSGVPAVTVQVSVKASAAEARQEVEQQGGSELSGVGDVARVSSQSGLGVAVFVARGSTVAVLTTVRHDVPPLAVVRLATTLAGRL
jgi:Protein of unknown function (DUF3558)